jgi:hypothetical protein
LSEHLDIKGYALELLELSKKFLAEDRTLDPTAFIVTKSGEPVLRPMNLEDEEHKADSTEKIIREAKEHEALAIITIFIARSKEFADEDFDEQSYFWGKLEQEGAPRNILLTLSGPAITNWAVTVPFQEKNNKIVFSQQHEIAEGVVLSLLPGWASENIRPS